MTEQPQSPEPTQDPDAPEPHDPDGATDPHPDDVPAEDPDATQETPVVDVDAEPGADVDVDVRNARQPESETADGADSGSDGE